MDAGEKELSATDVKDKAIKSVKWTYLGQLAPRFLQPVIMLVLVAFLSPADFGVMGVAMIAIGLSQIIQDFGFEKTLIQRRTDIKESANIVFWSNLALGVFLYAVIFLGSSLISQLFQEPRLTDILKVLCLQIVLVSTVKVHSALLQRDFQFKKLFIIRMSSSLVPLISLPLAYMGYGVWSLVWGTLLSSLIQLVFYWYMSGWRPALSFDLKIARQLYGFGAWVTLEMLMGWIIVEGDSLIIGYFLGVYDLGVFKVGKTLVSLIFDVFFTPALPVIYSSFSRLQLGTHEYRSSFLNANNIIATISLPIGVGLLIVAVPVSALVFSGKWTGIEYVIAIIGLMYAIAWLVGINPDVYRAAGRPDVNVKMMLVQMVFYIPAYVLAAPLGLMIFCLARLGVAVAAMPLHFYLVNRILELPFTYLKSCIIVPLISSLIMGLVLYVITGQSGWYPGIAGWAQLIVIVALGFGIHAVVLWLLDKRFLKRTTSLLKAAIK